jgi:L,D-transpeptidase catalytic domain
VPWVLVLAARRGDDRRCWLKVTLPWRPNGAVGWIEALHVRLRPTRWRIVVSLAARAVTLYRSGLPVFRARVVIGANQTPTPQGLFSIASVWRSPATSFVGTYILALTAHSGVLRHFDGGNGQVALHGRGGASLRDPLGSARSHGCVRLANDAIDTLVRLIGPTQLAGTPVRIG